MPFVGRSGRVSVLDAALRDAEAGRGSVVVLVGEPGLGKTRLVQECRKRFMGWAGAGSGGGFPVARGPLRLVRLYHPLRPLPAPLGQLARGDHR